MEEEELMPSFFAELMNTDFGKLDALADKWRATHKDIKGLAKRVQKEMLKPLKDEGYWEGAAAPYAWAQIDNIRDQIESATKVADSVRKVIEDAVGELRVIQKDLKDAVRRAKDKGLHVGSDGVVSRPGGASTEKAMDDAQDEIIDLVKKGIQADHALAVTLMTDIGLGTWFNSGKQRTDINHTDSISENQYNAVGRALDGKDPWPDRNNVHPYRLGWDWLSGTGPEHREFTNGDKLTELIRRSESMKGIREKTLKQWRETGEVKDDASYSIAEDGYIGAGKKLFAEDIPSIVTNDKDGLGQAFTGSYKVKYEVKGVEDDGSLVVRYELNNKTSRSSFLHYIGYHKWMDIVNSDIGPGRTIQQKIVWTERIPADGS
ncbi:hypothetical protein [Streptomyces sparsogenes]|uniref:hypothetical protein n=1 Tax=Streptomyces sparsogenes TaxID=67365 RepID=UPI0033D5F46F